MGFVYTSFQERATFVSHGNTARLAKEGGDPVLARLEVGDAVPVKASPGTSRVEPVPAGVVKASPELRAELEKSEVAIDVAKGEVLRLSADEAKEVFRCAPRRECDGVMERKLIMKRLIPTKGYKFNCEHHNFRSMFSGFLPEW